MQRLPRGTRSEVQAGEGRCASSHIHLQRGDESLLRDVDLAVLAHLLLAFLLLVEKLALARDVAAIALRRHVLAQRAHGFARDDLATDGGLDRYLEHVWRDELLELLHHGPAAAFCAGAVNQHGERVDRIGVDQDLHFYQVGGLVVGEVIVERGVTLRYRLQAIVEIEDHFVQRQIVFYHGAIADIGELDLDAAAVLAELEHATEIVVGCENGGADPGFVDLLDLHRVRHVDRIVDLDLLPVAQVDLVDDGGSGRNQVEIELALQPLLDDLEMQQAQKAAAEAEAERGRGFHLIAEARVIEPEPAHGRAQILELCSVDRKQAAEHDRNGRTKAGQGLGHRLSVVGDCIPDAGVGHILDRGGQKADLAGPEFPHIQELRREHADAVHLVSRAGTHHADAVALLEHAVDDAHQHDDAEIAVIPAVDQQRLERRAAVAAGRRQARDDGFQHFRNVEPGLCRNQDGVRGVEPDHVLDLLPYLLGLGGWQVDLVEDRHYFVIVL